MEDREERLIRILQYLIRIRNERASEILSECGLCDLTVRQLAYLRTIDEHGEMTFSRLAEAAGTSKPTVTEAVNRFVRMDCVYRQPSAQDRRVVYIRLTERGKKIARADEDAVHRMAGEIIRFLNDEDRELLVRILRKVG